MLVKCVNIRISMYLSISIRFCGRHRLLHPLDAGQLKNWIADPIAATAKFHYGLQLAEIDDVVGGTP